MVAKGTVGMAAVVKVETPGFDFKGYSPTNYAIVSRGLVAAVTLRVMVECTHSQTAIQPIMKTKKDTYS